MPDPIADDTLGPAALLEWGEPLGIAFYPNYAEKADLVARMKALAQPRQVHEVRRGEEALDFVGCDCLVIVDPEQEEEAVSFFDRCRDHFEAGPAQILLLLLRGGAGERALKDAPALASFARDASFEVSARPNMEQARADFGRRHGLNPEDWLGRWRNGDLPDTLENNHVLSEALELEESP